MKTTFNEFISENNNWYDIEPKLKILRSYINILNSDDTVYGEDEHNKYEYASQYFLLLHNFLIVERMFQDIVTQSNKEINNNLKLEKLNAIDDVYKKFLELYDSNSKVRFGVETLDSIEEVKVYLDNNREKIYNRLLRKKNNLY